jgi:hypothetical protein
MAILPLLLTSFANGVLRRVIVAEDQVQFKESLTPVLADIQTRR